MRDWKKLCGTERGSSGLKEALLGTGRSSAGLEEALRVWKRLCGTESGSARVKTFYLPLRGLLAHLLRASVRSKSLLYNRGFGSAR